MILFKGFWGVSFERVQPGFLFFVHCCSDPVLAVAVEKSDFSVARIADVVHRFLPLDEGSLADFDANFARLAQW